MKFPPLGRRSWGPRACAPLSGFVGPAYLHEANAITLAIAMIETREALDALDDILAVPGIDGVFVGPSDLSIALSTGGAVDPRGTAVEAALTKIAAAAPSTASSRGCSASTARRRKRRGRAASRSPRYRPSVAVARGGARRVGEGEGVRAR